MRDNNGSAFPGAMAKANADLRAASDSLLKVEQDKAAVVRRGATGEDVNRRVLSEASAWSPTQRVETN